MFSTGVINPSLISPELLIKELEEIQKQLPNNIKLPESPKWNIWHYYKFLSISHTTHNDKIIMLIKVPLVENDSTLELYRVYNLPVFNPAIGKSLKYNIESETIAVTLDRKTYAALPTPSEFLECTLANGHFCSLKSALYDMQASKLCIFALFLKNETAINENCEFEMVNTTGPLAMYLDDGTWAISTTTIEQMEVTCPTLLRHVIPIHPPLRIVELQPACSAFSAGFILPPYFRKFSQGFPVAIKGANLHLKIEQPIDFRAWKSLNVSNLSDVQIDQLKTLKPANSVPVNVLKAEIGNLKRINLGSNKDWVWVGGSSGSGILLLVIVGLCVYCCSKQQRGNKARSIVCRPVSEHETLNMKHTQEVAISSVVQTELGQETVRAQSLDRPNQNIQFDESQLDPESLRLLDQLDKFGIGGNNHHRTSESGTSVV